MRTFLMGSITFAACIVGASCSSSSSPPGPSEGDASVVDAGSGSDTGSVTDTGSAADTSSSTVRLSIQNYLSWCTVSVEGASGTTTASQTLDVAPGTVVHVQGDAASATFVWGYWVGTAGDTSVNHDTQKSTTVTVTKNTVIQACCPFASSPDSPCPPPS